MLELCGCQVTTSVLPNFSIIWVLLLPKVPWFDLDIYVHCFLPVGRFAGNGYVSADVVHIFCLFSDCWCFFDFVVFCRLLLFVFESFAVGVLCGCCVFVGG